MNLNLYDHQKTALSYLRIYDHFALFMEQGTGKTIPSLVRILELATRGKIKSALIVAPKSALGAWGRDIEKFEPYEQELLKAIIHLVNYDIVWRRPVEDMKADCIILDEAQCIKNRTSKRSQRLLLLGTMAKYRYILTGTPIANGQLENLWSLFCFLDPYLYKHRVYSTIWKEKLNELEPKTNHMGSYYEFQDFFCRVDMFYKPVAYRHVSDIQDVMKSVSYRVEKKDCLDLPEKLPDEIIKVPQTTEVKKYYHKMATGSAIEEFDILAENPLTRLVKLRQLSSGHLKTEERTITFKSEKLNALGEILDSIDPSKKVVIFADFKQSIKLIAKYLTERHETFVTLDGEQKDKTIWRRFQTDAGIRLIICQYQTASAGIDLFASDTIIYYEPTLRSQLLEQSRDRIHRTGQTSKCSYIHLLTIGTVEVDIYRTLAGYQDFNEKLYTKYIDNYKRTGRKV